MRGNARAHRFTIYDVMEAQGILDENKANTSSPDYGGPLEYPKMFYHPRGETRVTQRAEIIATPLGPQKVGEQLELVHRIANNADEERAFRELGWHDHPSKAIAASGKEAPPTVSYSREDELRSQIEALQAQLAAAEAAVKTPFPKADDL